MEGLFSLLLVAALFYFMMRFGCGAHMVHGHGRRGEHAGDAGHGGVQGGSARDPVCGMDVAPGQGYTMTYGGREYRLCSRACLDRFEGRPDQYAPVQGGAQ